MKLVASTRASILRRSFFSVKERASERLSENTPGPSIVLRPRKGGRSVAVMLLLFGSLFTVALKWRAELIPLRIAS